MRSRTAYVTPASPETLQYEPSEARIIEGALWEACPLLDPPCLKLEEMAWQIEPPLPTGMNLDPEEGESMKRPSV